MLVLFVALLAPAASLRAQSGRKRPDPLPSPSPGAQQRPRRATPPHADESLPGEPASPNTPSRAERQNPPAQTDASKSPQTIDDDEVLLVNSNLVPVSANVTDAAGRAVTDLKLEDFELRVDGQPKPISDISHAETPVRIALLYDNSSSIRPTRELEKQAAVNFFRSVLRPVDQAAIFSISTLPSLDQPLTSDVRRLVSTIESYGKVDDASTALFDTIVMAADYLRPQPGRKVMIIVSDGVETTSQLQDFGEMVRRVLASDCQVFVIQTGLSENANLRDLVAERRMQDLTSYTGGFVNVPRANADLEAAFSQIAADLSQQYVLSYYPNDDPRDGRFRVINVRVTTRPNMRVRARRGYYPRRAANLSEITTSPAASPALAIRDPAVAPPNIPPAAPRGVAGTGASANAPANTGATPNANGASARTHAVTNATTHGSKNLDPDAGEPADEDASARPTVRLGSFNPQPSPPGASDSSPPRSDTTRTPADDHTQPSPQTAQPASNRSNAVNSTTSTASATPTAAPPSSNGASAPDAALSSSADATALTNAKPATGDNTPAPSDADRKRQPAQASPSSPQPQREAARTRPRTTTQANDSAPSPPRSSQSQSAQQSTSPPQSSSASPPQPSPSEPAKPPVVAGGVLNSRAKSLPLPQYPEAARRMRVVGTVSVEVAVDESGKVVEARAVTGPAQLRDAAVSAARRAVFAQTLVGGQPARLTGVLNYTFVL
ncbi:MAG: VWA domain-containing protein [Acidobacteria bacterium]|nr:VWA domain-containing protein [Acidobacteriota bacterium]